MIGQDLVQQGFSGPWFKTKVTIDFSQAAWNTVANHRVFTVTGTVRAICLYKITGNAAAGAGGTIAFGITGTTGDYAAAQGFAGLVTPNIINPGGTVATNVATFTKFLAGGVNADKVLESPTSALNIGFAIAVNAFTAGTIDAYCFWAPLSDDGVIVAATGGAL